jgi:hypothetical protein
MKKGSELNRRGFLKIAGAGSLSLAASSVLSGLAAGAAKGSYTNFHFLALSQAVDGEDVHNLLMGGHGIITSGNVVGNGSFQHQLASDPAPIKPILGEGSWKVKRLVNWTVIGTYGIGVAGILNLEVNLVPENGSSFPAMLEVVCNIPPGGLFTGKPEGYVLDTGGPIGPFTPLGPPPLGITWFTTAIEPQD